MGNVKVVNLEYYNDRGVNLICIMRPEFKGCTVSFRV